MITTQGLGLSFLRIKPHFLFQKGNFFQSDFLEIKFLGAYNINCNLDRSKIKIQDNLALFIIYLGMIKKI